MKRRITLILWLALRNLRRQVRRSLLTALAMVIGSGLLMFSLPIADGTHEQWIDSAVRMGSGHVLIQAPGFQESRKIADRLSSHNRLAVEGLLLEADASLGAIQVSPQLSTNGLASSPAGARPVQVLGVDPVAEAAFGVLDERVTEGRYLESGDRLSAYVGSGLMESLELRMGSRLVLTAQDAAGEIAGQLVRVVGVFRTGIPEVDQALIHVPLSTAGRWLQTGDNVTTIAVFLDSSTRVPAFVEILENRLSDRIANNELAVLGWRQANPELDAAVKLDDLGNYLFQGILFSIIALGIVNTVLMSVLNRYREFGLLRALGLTPSQTGWLVLSEGLVLTLLSGTIGIALGLFVTWYFWGDGLDFSSIWDEEWSFAGVVMEPIVVPSFRLIRVVQGFLFIFAIGALASLYPAYQAAKVDVMEAMKFDR